MPLSGSAFTANLHFTLHVCSSGGVVPGGACGSCRAPRFGAVSAPSDAAKMTEAWLADGHAEAALKEVAEAYEPLTSTFCADLVSACKRVQEMQV